MTHLEKEQLLLGAPEERMFEHTGGGGPGLWLSADHLLNQILCYHVICYEGEIIRVYMKLFSSCHQQICTVNKTFSELNFVITAKSEICRQTIKKL